MHNCTINRERVDYLLKSAKYIAGEAIGELHESHGGYWNTIRNKIIPCLIILLERIRDQFYYWNPQNDAKIAEVSLVIKALEELRNSNPDLNDQVIKPLELVINFKSE
ncbi:MAG: hypothetical protein WC666_00845 [Candidatus Paceibacterota bacterium]|jgi:hypothetical protein